MTDATKGTDDKGAASLAFSGLLETISQRIVVFSGKGGVGKTTVAVNLAYALVDRGLRVGLLDADVTGPNVVQMTGVTEAAQGTKDRIVPHVQRGLKLVSLASMLPKDSAIIWRGPMRSKVIEQLLNETAWGDLDVLVVDLPPGTGDEVLTIAQRMEPQTALVVTTPQEVARSDARRAVNFARKLNISRIGIVENMSGLTCPHCGERIDLFGSGEGAGEASRLGVEFFGEIPFHPSIPRGGDTGEPIVLEQPKSALSEVFRRLARDLMADGVV
jgi:Mrp family chromosome partitioning ATPase